MCYDYFFNLRGGNWTLLHGLLVFTADIYIFIFKKTSFITIYYLTRYVLLKSISHLNTYTIMGDC